MELFLVVILEVPEFQYDIVKSRGAVWDDKIKKWCADRKHLNALCEWIPYYKESYYYGKEVQGINTIELQEFDKFFDNNIDIINQYLYLCIANIKCPHCWEETPVVFKISCYEYYIDDGSNDFFPFRNFSILPLKDIMVMNKSNPVISYLYEYLHDKFGYDMPVFITESYDDKGNLTYNDKDYLCYNTCRNCHRRLNIEDEKLSLWFSDVLFDFSFDVLKIELKYDLIYSYYATPAIIDLKEYYYEIPDEYKNSTDPLHSNSPFCTEAYKTWENEGFYKTEFFAKWKQKFKNAEVIRFTF